MFWQIFVRLCNENKTTPNGVARQLGFSSGTVTWWKKGREPRDTALQKIADYFGVTVEYLLGETEERGEAADMDDVKVALFGGATEVTEEMWEEVANFARYVAQKHKNDKKQ